MDTIDRRIKKVLIKLLREKPFYGFFLLQVPVVEDESIPTACTNGEVIRYSPKFFKDRDEKFIEEVLEHEVLHIVLHHVDSIRMRGRDVLIWNIATDHVIDMIQKEAEKIPSSEEVYEQIIKEMNKNSGSGDGSSGERKIKIGEKEITIKPGFHQVEPSKVGDEIEQKIIKAAVSAATDSRSKAFGNLPSSIREKITKLTSPPKISWQEVLVQYLANSGEFSTNWGRRNKKSPESIHLPGKKRDPELSVVLALDVSGSISMEELQKFSNECKFLLGSYPCKGYILQFDSEIQAWEEITEAPSTILDVRSGAGGTSFTPIFKFVEEKNLGDDILIIIFTDLEGSFPREVPPYPVIWISTYKKEAPFGQVIEYDL